MRIHEAKSRDLIGAGFGPGPVNHEVDPNKIPILYEDDVEVELGESNIHVLSNEILHVCLMAHLADRTDLQVFSDLNLYYHLPPAQADKVPPYVSPDIMVVRPIRRLPEDTRSYEIDRDGPAPVFVAEILSERSYQQRDLDDKVRLYPLLGIAEYLLVDVTARYLPQRLLLKRLQPVGTWQDHQEPDGSVISDLGFRVIIESDNRLRLINSTVSVIPVA